MIRQGNPLGGHNRKLSDEEADWIREHCKGMKPSAIRDLLVNMLGERGRVSNQTINSILTFKTHNGKDRRFAG